MGFAGGEKLKAKLEEIAKQASKADSVNVGFLAGATYPNGTPVALIAATNEFGGTVTVPEHDVTLNRNVKSDGEFAQNGRFVKSGKANFQTVHHVDEYTITIPSRPYFRGMIAAKKGQWGPQLGKIIKATDYDSTMALGQLAELVEGQLKESIRDFSEPANAKSTIAKKGFDDPLVDSGHMMNSTGWELNE
jgi:hypothetical protein